MDASRARSRIRSRRPVLPVVAGVCAVAPAVGCSSGSGSGAADAPERPAEGCGRAT
ncbi:hypothetical protein [Streptomyces sp. NPDC047974]|uniref:hypothetical protein n=1 Tax=Streptomyces sp. NPDC047974 TaxID=3154343 RepID=UPI0033C45253